MLVNTENTIVQFITKLAMDMDNHGDLHGWISIFVISMDMVDIHLKVEYFEQEKPLMESNSMELTLYNLL